MRVSPAALVSSYATAQCWTEDLPMHLSDAFELDIRPGTPDLPAAEDSPPALHTRRGWTLVHPHDIVDLQSEPVVKKAQVPANCLIGERRGYRSDWN